MNNQSELRQRLTSQWGDGACLTEAIDRAPFETDFRKLFHGEALAILQPNSVTELQSMVRFASDHRLVMVPAGGNTSYCGGAAPDKSGNNLIISLKRLNKIRSKDPLGYTLTAEAGCTLASVQEAAESVERYFPLALGSQGSCQLGGNLSTNAGGTSVLRYGMMRDLVLGLEVVLPDGRLLNQLNGLRKDNTGFDVKQWFIGAEGTLGIISAATLKLFTKPTQYSTAMIGVAHIGAAVDLLSRLREYFGDVIESFEFLPESATELARQHLKLRDPFETSPPPARVLLECAQPRAWPELPERLAHVLMKLIESGLVLDVAMANSDRERDHFWSIRERIPEAQTLEGASIKHDISLPIGQLATFVSEAARVVQATIPGARIINYGHVGDGNLHYNLSPPCGTTKGSDTERQFLANQSAITRTIHDLVASLGGSFSAEHGIGQLKVKELERYEDPVALELMKKLKVAIDPLNLMNSGKVVK
jgi:FAD/FMN-containing dehydrogenase